ncbi:MAG: rhodanese-like domain-containing protein [Phycisphaeraceae bacterium]|nr:rhodanese-like domain-containing protein [Phycisphaeraceae bacterium]
MKLHARLAPLFLAMALLSVALVGCDRRTDDRDIQWVTVTEAESLTQPRGFSLSRAKTMAYVDPRTEADFAAGHIPGAILVPFADLRSGAAAPLRDFDVLVVYDTDFDDVVARAMSKRLIEDGRWDVFTLTGGLRAWEKSGNEVAYGMTDRGGTTETGTEAIGKPSFGRVRSR